MPNASASRPSELNVADGIVADGIARITLRRPGQRYRLGMDDLVVLSKQFRSVDADGEVRILVLQAETTPERPVFCAGYHIGEVDAGPVPLTLNDVAALLEGLRPVTVCAPNGSLYGGGVDVAMACDIAVGAGE